MRRYKKVKMKPPWLQRLLQTGPRRATSSKHKRQTMCIFAPTLVCLMLSINARCDTIRIIPTTPLTNKFITPPSRLPSGQANLNAAAPAPADASDVRVHRVSSDENVPFNNLDANQLGPDRSLQSTGASGPRFAQSQDSTVIASIYQNEVYLPCKVLNLDDEQTVSWIRKRDSLVLTINKLRLIDDNRFQLTQANDDWTLVLRQPTDSDAGFYECQVSSLEPKLSHSVELRLVRAESMISNLSTLFVRPNDTVNLTCSIFAPQPTNYVYWYKNTKEFVQFDNNLMQQPPERNTGTSDENGGTSNELLLTRRIQHNSEHNSTREPNSRATGRFADHLEISSTATTRGKRFLSGGSDKVIAVVNNVFVAEAPNADKSYKDDSDDVGTIGTKYGMKRTKTETSDSSFATNLNQAKVKLGGGEENYSSPAASMRQQLRPENYATQKTGFRNNNERVKSDMNKESSESMPFRELKLNSKEQEVGDEFEQDNSNNNNSDNNKPLQRQFLVHSSSSLIIKQAQLNDTANYTCSPSNAKPSHMNLVVVENGLGSQPEKRSLQVDSATSLISNQFERRLWLKVKALATSLAYEFASQGMLTFKYNAQSQLFGEQTGHEHGSQNQENLEITPMPELIRELFTDHDVWRLVLSIVATLCMMLLYH